MKNFNKEIHLKRIKEALNELRTLEKRTADPAPLTHRYIGTVVDNTISLLTAPANSLDNGKRRVIFEKDIWLSLMQAVHRSFLSSIHFAIEIGLNEILKESKITVQSSMKLRTKEKLEKIKNMPPEGIKLLDNLTKNLRPSFEDHLNAVLKLTSLQNGQKKRWRNFFKGLTIVRNKCVHSDASLDDYERKVLREGGLAVLVSHSGELQGNPKMYYQFANLALNFFEIINDNLLT